MLLREGITEQQYLEWRQGYYQTAVQVAQSSTTTSNNDLLFKGSEIFEFALAWGDKTEELYASCSPQSPVMFRRCFEESHKLVDQMDHDLVFLQEALVIFSHLWYYGDIMCSSLTVLEQKLLRQTIFKKIEAYEQSTTVGDKWTKEPKRIDV